MSTFEENFKKEKLLKLKENLGIKNTHDVPTLSKIVINMGVRDVLADKKNMEKGREILTKIAGQKPRIMKAKKAISTFKLRQGDEIALMVTLRGKRMYEFYEKLTKIVMPRIRDFRGVSRKSFDGRGNYTLGFPESTVFPEIDPATVDRVQGLELTIVTTAKDNNEGIALLEILGMPFVKN
ncbi:MAG TPA: 50S ribosomal protein L5 [Patescibacteria group bacterium]|nr:50S ribosomal protein L5 [Patescibacteria group bacterium]